MNSATSVLSPEFNTRTDGNTDARWLRCVLWIIGGLLLFRLAYAAVVPLDLVHDEAYYWDWSRQLDWGYYSKPPMIAWIIGTSTFFFGEAEWAVRLMAPVLHTLTTLMIFQIGALLYSPRIGFWSALTFATAPTVAVSLRSLLWENPIAPGPPQLMPNPESASIGNEALDSARDDG